MMQGRIHAENMKGGGPGNIVDNLSRKLGNFTPFLKKYSKFAAKVGVQTTWTPLESAPG